MSIYLGGRANAGTVTYGYDPLGRLISASYSDGSCATFSYDAAGNRTQYTGSAAPPVAGTVSVTGNTDLPTATDPRASIGSCAPLTVTSVGTPTAPAHGSVAVQTGGVGVTYTPNAGYSGPDAFSYVVSNGTQNSTGTVNVSVQSPTLRPTALNGFMLSTQSIPPPSSIRPVVTLDVSSPSLINDPYGYPLSISATTNGAYGTVTFSGTVLTYTYYTSVPDSGPGVATSDTFTYTISDGHGHTATANVSAIVIVNTGL